MGRFFNMGRRLTVMTLASAVILGALSGCGSNSSTDAGSATASGEEAGYTLNLAKTTDAGLTNPLIQIAQENGYYDEYNLTLENTTLELNGTFEALSIGKVDTTYGQLIPGLSYGAQGSDVTLFAGTLSGGMCVITKEENASELSDLSNWKDHSIGVIQLSTSEMVTKYVLGNEYGYTIGNDLTYTLIDNYPDIVTAVAKGNVDIGFISSEYLESATDIGLTYLMPLADIYPDYVCCRQTAYSKSLEENRDAFVAYLKGQIRAYKDLNTNQEESLEALVEISGESEDYVNNYVFDKEANAKRTYNPDPNYNGTLAVYETLVEWDYVEDGTDLSEFYDLSIYAEALQQVIEENPDDSFYQDMWTYFLTNNSDYPEFGSLYTEEGIV